MQSPEETPDLAKLSNSEILSQLEKLSRTERKITHLVLCHINQVEERKLYFDLGFESLYKYLTQHLHYSESAAYHRLQAARVLKKNPEIAGKIEAGTLKLSQLVQVEQSLHHEQKTGQGLSSESRQELLVKLENKSVFETEKILASEFNLTPKAQQRIKPQKDDSVRIELTLSQEQYEVIKKAQSLISHSVPENNLAEGMAYLAQAHIKRIEGVNKARASKKSSSSKNKTSNSTDEIFTLQENKSKLSFEATPGLTPSFSKSQFKHTTVRQKRKALSLKIRRTIFQKAENCCEYIHPPTGKRCGSRFQLQVDHVIPLACGGTDELTNLRVLCGVCNRREAQRWGLKRPS